MNNHPIILNCKMKLENIFMKGVVWTLDLIKELTNIYVVMKLKFIIG